MADTGEPATRTYNPAGVDVVVAGGRLKTNTTRKGFAAIYWTSRLANSHRIIWAKASFEIFSGSTPGGVGLMLWDSDNFPDGLLPGGHVNAPVHLGFLLTGYQLSWWSAYDGLHPIAAVAYASPRASGSREDVEYWLDLRANTIHIIGADGVEHTYSDTHLGTVAAYYAGMEIYYNNASTDGRAQFLSMEADSVRR